MDVNSPIHKLPEDVLLNIFILNAMLEKMPPYDPEHLPDAWSDSPLCTTLSTTQVCPAWRTIALSSALIWGRLLDLDQLSSKSPHLQYEVLGRSQLAPLYVRGGVGAIAHENDYFNDCRWDSATWQFFSDVIQTQWRRIRSLDITIYRLDDTREDIWRTFQSPAPCLEYFSLLDVQDVRPSVLYSETLPLFSNHCPLLRSFRGPDCMVLLKHPNAWARQLREFKLFITGTPLRYTATTLLEALSEMQSLESLWLAYPFRGDTHLEGVHRPLTLRNLQSIVFEDSGHRAHMFFANLTLPSAFYSDVIIRLNYSEIGPDAFIEQCNLLHRLAAGFVAHGGDYGKEISIDINPNRFEFSAHSKSDRHMRVSHFSFALYGPILDTTFIFLTEFTVQPFSPIRAFSNATHLHLNLDFYGALVDGFTEEVVKLIQVLPLITTLEIGAQSIMASVFRNTGPVFPSLRLMKILGQNRLPPLKRLFAVFDALKNSRDTHGLDPIDTFDIRRSGKVDSQEKEWHPEDFTGVVEGKYAGLKVIYTWRGETKTYICGSGSAILS